MCVLVRADAPRDRAGCTARRSHSTSLTDARLPGISNNEEEEEEEKGEKERKKKAR